MSVDVSLYPLDTIKTRLQASEPVPFHRLFRGVYRGVSSVILASAPGGNLVLVIKLESNSIPNLSCGVLFNLRNAQTASCHCASV